MINSVHFIRPYWLWGLIPIFFIILLLWKTRTKNTVWENICDPHLLDRLLISTSKNSKALPLTLLAFGWFVGIIALAGPSFSKVNMPIYQKLDSKIIVLDLSPSMNASDVKPSRLTRAKYKIKEILKNSKEGQIGLIVFADEPYTVSPLTHDAKTILSMIPNLSTEIMPTTGQRIGRALSHAAKIMQQAGIENGKLLLITPGPVKAKDHEIARQLSENGYKTSVLSIGSLEGAPIAEDEGNFLKDAKGNILFSYCDKCGLQELAGHGQGHYMDFTNNNEDINALLGSEVNPLKSIETLNDNLAAERWKDDGIWLVYLLLPLTLLGFRRGWLI
jgi:Ca-activated chloride channel family protein